MAAHLSLMGFHVTVFNRTSAHISAIAARGGIDVDGPDGIRGLGRLAGVTHDLREALAGADVVMVVVPSSAHGAVAASAAPHLRDGQIVVLHGGTCAALEFAKILADRRCSAHVTVAEADNFLYASRTVGPTQTRIFGIKQTAQLAALPAANTGHVLAALNDAYPQYIDGVNVLHTGLNNIGAMFHPVLALLNAGRIECTGGDFQFYIEGATPSIARVMEELDRERMAVAAALGIPCTSATRWLQMAYNATGADLHEALHNQSGYVGIKAPSTLSHRFIVEDVPMVLVPIAALGRQFGVAVPTMESIIELAGVIGKTNYWRHGRTPAKLGIAKLNVSELTRYVHEVGAKASSLRQPTH
jgi:opine dehydrogenase